MNLSGRHRKVRVLFSALLWIVSYSCTNIRADMETVRFVPFNTVRLQDPFWAPRLEINRRVTIPHNLAMCRQMGILDNFIRAAGQEEGDYAGLMNWDEFLYKAIEAASYSLQEQFNRELDEELDRIIAIVAAAQEPDGYLRTPRTIALLRGRNPSAPPRWSNLQDDLELYCSGHLFEAAVAHHRATGKRALLDVAVRNADLICKRFGPGLEMGVPGHEEIELALVRLYETTGNASYLNLSQFFIDQRGNSTGHRLYGSFSQDHLPVREQREAVGQAPRATYLYSGMADIEIYRPNAGYHTALKSLWSDIVGRKMYITGGIGSKQDNEGFGDPYDLPNRTAYSEICAAISFPMWAIRMFNLQPDAGFMDVIERVLYNNFAAGVSLCGDRYFYACPLESDGRYQFNLGWCPPGTKVPHAESSATRKEWFPCACCPPNVARFMPQISGLVYAIRDRELFVNLYIAGSADLTIGGRKIRVEQTGQYPWNDTIQITMDPEQPIPLTLLLRIPGWARNQPVPSDLYRFADSVQESAELRVNQHVSPIHLEKGYVKIARTWHKGDRVELRLPMPVRRLVSHSKVTENAGKVALQRGPIVYCAEGQDNGSAALNLVLPIDATVEYRWESGFLGGIVVLEANGFRKIRDGNNQSMVVHRIRWIPYAVWSNRGVGEMTVWMKTGEQHPGKTESEEFRFLKGNL